MNKESTPEVPPQPATQPIAPQPASGMPPKKKLSKGMLWGIIGGGGLIVIAIIVAVTFMLLPRGTTKQDYQTVVDATLETSGLYSDLLVGALPRAQMRYANPLQQNYESSLKPIEAKERAIAEKIFASEKTLDEKADALNDDEAKKEYQEYLKLRKNLYGDNGDIKQHIEKFIVSSRVNYGCERLFDEDNQIDYDDVYSAKQFAAYTDGCAATLGTVLDNSAIDDSTKKQFALLKEYFEKSSQAVNKMVVAGKIDEDGLKPLDDEYEKKLTDLESDAGMTSKDEGLSLSIDDLQEKLDEYFDLVVNKRNNAVGNYGMEAPSVENLEDQVQAVPGVVEL